MSHAHLNSNIKRIEYIQCKTKADMIWKEIYYINLFANEKTENVHDLYEKGVTDIHLNDEWKIYQRRIKRLPFDEKKVGENYNLLSNEDLIAKSNLIHIVDYPKINQIGNRNYALSRRWFYNNNDTNVETLKNNVMNFFTNLCKAKADECLWTTYDDFEHMVKEKEYARGYVAPGHEIDDDKFQSENRVYLAYLCNNFYSKNISLTDITEDEYALSELLRFINYSAIKNNKEIYIFIPSKRMRDLLQRWINRSCGVFSNTTEQSLKIKKGNFKEKKLVELYGSEKQKESYAKYKKFNGCNKRHFLRRLSRYCDIKDLGNRKYRITNVFKYPLPKCWSKMNDSLYQYITPLILNRFVNDPSEDNQLCAPAKEWAIKINMINKNYELFTHRKNDVSKITEIPLNIIKNFYSKIYYGVEWHIRNTLRYLREAECYYVENGIQHINKERCLELLEHFPKNSIENMESELNKEFIKITMNNAVDNFTKDDNLNTTCNKYEGCFRLLCDTLINNEKFTTNSFQTENI